MNNEIFYLVSQVKNKLLKQISNFGLDNYELPLSPR